jgi:hypothetical protein
VLFEHRHAGAAGPEVRPGGECRCSVAPSSQAGAGYDPDFSAAESGGPYELRAIARENWRRVLALAWGG